MLWIVATLAAFFIKGLCGFANTLVLTSILGFGVANVDISPVELILGYPPNLIQTWKFRKHLKPRLCLPVIVLVLAGSIPGAILLKNADIRVLKAFFGAVIIFIGIEMLVREHYSQKKKGSKALMFVIGLVSGILCGLFGVGALLAAYVGRITDTSEEFKANIGAVFLAENTVRLVLYSVLGVITPDSLKHTVLLIPVMLIALFAGMKSASVMNEKLIKKLVIILLIISGVVLLVRNLG
ncbi:MAG: sulfite exporter TauE/SafE family protein [Lachnospiraceae bacterium]|nr:sulfite exporter TauE/SafE family protein [Lachnospiraceae bacterium]